MPADTDAITAALEARLAAVEAEMSRLKAQVATAATAPDLPWWERITGRFADDPVYDEAMRLGAEWRKSGKEQGTEDEAKGNVPS